MIFLIRILRDWLVTPKWNNITKIVLTKDKELLDQVLMEANPKYRHKLLDKPLVWDRADINPGECRSIVRLKEKKKLKRKKKEVNVKTQLEDVLKNKTTIADILKTALALKIGKKQWEIQNKKMSFVNEKVDKPYKAMFQMLLDKSFKK